MGEYGRMLRLKYYFWKYKKQIKIYGGIVLLLLFLWGYSLYTCISYIKPAANRTDSTITISSSDSETSIVENFADGRIVEQTFVGDGKGISAFELSFGTYGQKSNGTLNVVLVNETTGEVIQTWQKKESQLKDNQNVKFTLGEEIEEDGGNEYTIRLYSTDNEKTDTVTVFTSKSDSYAQGVCMIDEQIQEIDLIFTIYPVSRDNHFIIPCFVIVCIVMLLLCCFVWYKIVCRDSYSIENLFLPFMLVMGLIYMFVLPPFSAPDETVHYVASYRISNRMMGVEDTDDDFVVCRESDNSQEVGINPSLNLYYYFYDNLFKHNAQTENNSLCAMAPLTKFSVISHFPQALGITVARLCHFSYAGLLYMGRLFALIFYIILTYLAIKIIPIGKTTLFAVSGLPIMLHEVSSFGYDGIVCAYSYLLLAYILYLVYQKTKIDWKDYVIVFELSMLLSPNKLVYFLIPFLVILIPKKKFDTQIKHILFKVGNIVLSTITAFAGNLLYVSNASSGTNIIEWANEEGFTARYVLTHIPRIIIMYVATFHEKMAFYMDSLIGGSLGWFDVDIPVDLTMMSLIILVIALFEHRNCRIKTSQRVVYISVFLCIALLVCATMLLGWTPISYTYIEGVQGRYFLPVLPLFMMCFINGTRKQERICRRIVILGSCVINYLVILRIVETIVIR